jgi:hypothetical protein
VGGNNNDPSDAGVDDQPCGFGSLYIKVQRPWALPEYASRFDGLSIQALQETGRHGCALNPLDRWRAESAIDGQYHTLQEVVPHSADNADVKFEQDETSTPRSNESSPESGTTFDDS